MARRAGDRTVHTIGIHSGRQLSVKQYCEIVRTCKADPDVSLPCTFTSWAPGTGRDLLREFRERMVRDHCNRGLVIRSGWKWSHKRIARLLKVRTCAWCGGPLYA